MREGWPPSTPLSDIRHRHVLSSFTHMGGVFIRFGDYCFMVRQPLVPSQAITRRNTSYRCLGTDWFTFLSCCSSASPAHTNTLSLTHTDSPTMQDVHYGDTTNIKAHFQLCNILFTCHGQWLISGVPCPIIIKQSDLYDKLIYGWYNQISGATTDMRDMRQTRARNWKKQYYMFTVSESTAMGGSAKHDLRIWERHLQVVPITESSLFSMNI